MMGSPPRLAVLMLRVLLPRRLRDEALDDLAELHAERLVRAGRRAAHRAYWVQLPAFALRLRFASIGGRLDDRPAGPARRERRERMSSVFSDVRYSVRTLLRNPGFTAIAAITLALGIGANTAIFGVIRTVLLRPLPFPDADRIVQLWETRLDRGWEQSSFTHANFWDVLDMNRAFEVMGAMRAPASFVLTGFDDAEQVSGASVSADFFRVLGVTPAAGRTFAPGEDESSADTRIIVLAHDFWVRRFAGDPSVVGGTLTLDGQSYSVIGVMPRGRPWLDAADVFVPLVRQPDANRGSFELRVIGRLKPGVTFEAALRDLKSIAQRLADLYPEPDRGMGIRMEPSSRWIADDTLRRALWILMGGAGLLLLIACVNLANLMLARATGRSRERALRTALGASRQRIVRLALTESLLIGSCGAVLGVGIAVALTRLLRLFDPGDIPRLADVAIDGSVLAFTVAVALVTGLLAGLVPALRTPYRDVVAALREGDRSAMGSRRLGRLRSILVATEIAMSLVLLVGAGLLLRSFAQVLGADRGFETENRLFFEVALPASYTADGDNAVRATQFRSDFLSRITSLNPVNSAAAINMEPLGGVGVGMGFAAGDRPPPPDQAVPWASWRLSTRDYFRTMGVPLLAGRDFTEHDIVEDTWPGAIISRRIAEELWPGENAVGRRINLWQGQNGPQTEVIGVVDDMLDWGLEEGPSYAVYLPFYGPGWRRVQFVVHTTASPTALVPTLRSMLAEIDPNLPLSNVQTLDDMVGESVASRRFMMMMLAAFAAVALLLALAGVYGVLSYTVARRRSEIGVRLALGATRVGVFGLVVRQGMVPVAVGLGFGVAGARALSGLMTGLLFGVTPADVTTYASVAAVLTLTAVLSCLVPARSAVALNVVSALREE